MPNRPATGFPTREPGPLESFSCLGAIAVTITQPLCPRLALPLRMRVPSVDLSFPDCSPPPTRRPLPRVETNQSLPQHSTESTLQPQSRGASNSPREPVPEHSPNRKFCRCRRVALRSLNPTSVHE